jgi:hypothetical protein
LFRILFALFLFLVASDAHAITPGIYECSQLRKNLDGEKSGAPTSEIPIPENRNACKEIEERLKRADQKVLICYGKRKPDFVNPEWVSLSEVRRPAVAGLSLVIWLQTDRGREVAPDAENYIKTLNAKIHKIQRQINALNYSRVLIITPTLSDSKLGWYVLKDTQTTSRKVHVRWTPF